MILWILIIVFALAMGWMLAIAALEVFRSSRANKPVVSEDWAGRHDAAVNGQEADTFGDAQAAFAWPTPHPSKRRFLPFGFSGLTRKGSAS